MNNFIYTLTHEKVLRVKGFINQEELRDNNTENNSE